MVQPKQTTMITVEIITSTEVYKNLKDQHSKKMLTSKDSRLKINHGLNVSKNIGFEEYMKTFKPSKMIESVVRELLSN